MGLSEEISDMQAGRSRHKVQSVSCQEKNNNENCTEPISRTAGVSKEITMKKEIVVGVDEDDERIRKVKKFCVCGLFDGNNTS